MSGLIVGERLLHVIDFGLRLAPVANGPERVVVVLAEKAYPVNGSVDCSLTSIKWKLLFQRLTVRTVS